jgi:hypothetical protein
MPHRAIDDEFTLAFGYHIRDAPQHRCAGIDGRKVWVAGVEDDR